MSRFSFLAALMVALFSVASGELNATVESFASLAAPSAAASWGLVTENAQWSPRAAGVVEWYAPQSRFLMYGIAFWEPDTEAANDVWYSSNGKSWTKQTYSGSSRSFNPDFFGGISFQGADNSQYVIQGSNRPNWEANSQVWISTNGAKSWTLQTGSKLLPGTRALGGGVSLPSAPKTLVIFGGQQDWGNQPGAIMSDVWMSTDAGKNWNLQTLNAPWGPRSVNQGLATTVNGVDVIYTVMGYVELDATTDTGIYENDIWISTDRGKKWSQLTDKAPWTARGDGQVEMTSSGVMIVTGGMSSFSVEGGVEVLNDVWASLDGGYSWGECTKDAPFSDRQFPYTVLDDKGFLYVMGGKERNGPRLNDVWKSAFSFNDVKVVADRCNLLIPSCGAGLKCLPGAPNFRSGLWGVTCDACPNSPTSEPTDNTTTASTSGMVPMLVLVVFIILFAVTLLLLAYTYYKLREAGAASPIPLPASAQRWWNKNSSEGLIGGSTGGSSLPDSTGDSLYNPLTIRDGM